MEGVIQELSKKGKVAEIVDLLDQQDEKKVVSGWLTSFLKVLCMSTTARPAAYFLRLCLVVVVEPNLYPLTFLFENCNLFSQFLWCSPRIYCVTCSSSTHSQIYKTPPGALEWLQILKSPLLVPPWIFRVHYTDLCTQKMPDCSVRLCKVHLFQTVSIQGGIYPV